MLIFCWYWGLLGGYLKKIIIVIGFLFIFNGCDLVKQAQNPASLLFGAEVKVGVADIIIKVDEGEFVFKNLSILYGGTYNTVSGNILNNTNKDWNDASFNIELYDKSSTMKTQNVTINAGSKKYFSVELESESSPDPKNLRIKYVGGSYPANYAFTMVKPKYSKLSDFSDNNIYAKFMISQREISFDLENKTQNIIKIDWNNVSYIDFEKQAHRIVHSGIKYIDLEKTQTPLSIPPGSRISDGIVSSDHVTRSSTNRWEHLPLFPSNHQEAKQLKGKEISVFMPLEINGIVKNYNFVFRIEDV